MGRFLLRRPILYAFAHRGQSTAWERAAAGQLTHYNSRSWPTPATRHDRSRGAGSRSKRLLTKCAFQ